MQVFIVALTQHFNFGHLLIPYFARQLEDGTLEIQEQVRASKKKNNLSNVEEKILKAASAYSDRSLKEIYSDEKTIPTFLKKLTERTLNQRIRPFIDTKILEILHLICEHDIPLYNRASGTKQLFSHHRIHTNKELVESSFYFELDETSFKYNIRCSLNGKELDLHELRPAFALTQEPASIVGNDLLLQFRNMPSNKIMPFFNRRMVEVSSEQADKYMEQIVIPAVIDHQVEAVGFNIIEEQITPIAKLGFEVSILNQPIITLSFQYGEKEFASETSNKKNHIKEIEEAPYYTIRYYSRDKAWEKEKTEQLLSLGLHEVGDLQFIIEDETLSMHEWFLQHKELLDNEYEYTSSKKENNLFVGEIAIQKRLSEKEDWFDLHMEVRIGSFTFPFTAFSHHILNGIREFTLPDKKIALLPEEWFHKYADLFLLGTSTAKTIKLKKTQYGLIQQMDESILTARYKTKTDFPLPDGLKATLRDYQKIGYQWLRHLRENKFGGCLADDMGLGKTIQTIALLQSIYPNSTNESTREEAQSSYTVDKQGQTSLFLDDTEDFIATNSSIKPQTANKRHASLIIAPTSVLKNWSREIKKFSNLRIFEYTGADRIRDEQINRVFDYFDVILTTYGLLRADIDLLSAYPFELVVLDESQNIKNPDSITYKSAIRLTAEQRITLTGTPIENSLKDGWAQFNFINPGMLGSYKSFREKYIQPIEKGGDEHISERLRTIIHPFMLRRTKEEVAVELPDLTEEILFCEMTVEQSEIYKEEKNKLRNMLLEMQAEGVLMKNRFTALQGILRLRQMANHPVLTNPEYAFSSGKTKAILDTFEELQEGGHKVLIFSAFTKHLALLESAFKERAWKYELLTGSTKNRQEVIDRFAQSQDTFAFFISLKAGGVGLNLTQADYVFIIDPWWNPAAEAQAIDRAHRIGQEKHVFAYRFITLQTIEENILALKEKKSKLFESFIHSNDPLELLNDADWEKLIHGKEML